LRVCLLVFCKEYRVVCRAYGVYVIVVHVPHIASFLRCFAWNGVQMRRKSDILLYATLVANVLVNVNFNTFVLNILAFLHTVGVL